MAMLAGQSVGFANEMKRASEVIKELIKGAEDIIRHQQ
jgi:hypothetical protein